MPQIRLITTKGSRVTPYDDSVIAFAMKGGDGHIGEFSVFKTSLERGKPYGIVEADYDDPLGLEFDQVNRLVYIKPGLFMAYGRL